MLAVRFAPTCGHSFVRQQLKIRSDVITDDVIEEAIGYLDWVTIQTATYSQFEIIAA